MQLASSSSKARRQRRRRDPPHSSRLTAVSSQQFQALLALILVFLVFILVEVLVVDTVFLGPAGHITNIHLSNQDIYISDTGALEEGVYLRSSSKKSKRVASTYGSEPAIIGLDTCSRYRDSVTEDDGPALAVVGLFQKQSKFFVQLMRKNCNLPESESDMIYNSGVEEHYPLQRFPNWVLPIVIVQDPLPWMLSICRDRPKELDLETPTSECPKLKVTRELKLNFSDYKNATVHDSLVDMWNDWYRPWIKKTTPRVMIRAEDILLDPEPVVTHVCQCLGGTVDNFRSEQAWHIDKAIPDRFEGYDTEILQYANENLHPELINAFQYGNLW